MQITSSQHLDAKKVLLRVPMEAKDFLETRALLLERLGRHQDALEYALSSHACDDLPCAAKALQQIVRNRGRTRTTCVNGCLCA